MLNKQPFFCGRSDEELFSCCFIASPGDTITITEDKQVVCGKVFEAESLDFDKATYLPGPKTDFTTLYGWCKKNTKLKRPHSMEYDFKLKKTTVMKSISDYFNSEDNFGVYILYYTGHGVSTSGNWAMYDGTISYLEIVDLWKKAKKPNTTSILLIVMDSCFSGAWIEEALKTRNQTLDCSIGFLCSSSKDEVSYDTEYGGLFTRFLFNRETIKRDGNLLFTKFGNSQTFQSCFLFVGLETQRKELSALDIFLFQPTI